MAQDTTRTRLALSVALVMDHSRTETEKARTARPPKWTRTNASGGTLLGLRVSERKARRASDEWKKRKSRLAIGVADGEEVWHDYPSLHAHSSRVLLAPFRKSTCNHGTNELDRIAFNR